MAFKDIAGHKNVLNYLKSAITANHLHPSLLFSGPSGVGKKTIAIAIAQALNCREKIPLLGGTNTLTSSLNEQETKGGSGVFTDACGKCITCKNILSSNHPDIFILKTEENKSGKERSEVVVGQVRELLKRIVYKPFEGLKTVFIVEKAEVMNYQAQNAILKALEEPPSFLQWILLSENPGGILPTVTGRCLTFNLNPLTIEEMEMFLKEKGDWTDDEIHLRAMLSNGCPGIALNINLKEAEKSMKNIINIISLISNDKIHDALSSCEVLAKESNIADVIPRIRIILRDILLIKNGMKINATKNLEEIASRIDISKIMRLMDGLVSLELDKRRHLDPRLSLESLFLSAIEIHS